MKRALRGALTGAVLLMGSDAPVVSQTLANPDRAGAARGAAPAAKKAAKPVSAQPTGTYDSEPGRLSDYWTIERALPGRTPERVSRAREVDTTPALRSIPLDNGLGNLGVASGQVRSNQLYDGTPIPGITQNSYNNSSYVGLSISSTNDSKTFPLIAPPATPWNGSNGW